MVGDYAGLGVRIAEGVGGGVGEVGRGAGGGGGGVGLGGVVVEGEVAEGVKVGSCCSPKHP